MGGLRGGASAQEPGGPADVPGLNVRRDVQGRRRGERWSEAWWDVRRSGGSEGDGD